IPSSWNRGGILISVTTTSGRCLLAAAISEGASAATPTTAIPSVASSNARTPSRTSTLSSPRTTRMSVMSGSRIPSGRGPPHRLRRGRLPGPGGHGRPPGGGGRRGDRRYGRRSRYPPGGGGEAPPPRGADPHPPAADQDHRGDRC